MTAAPRCASPIRPVRDAHLALGGHPCARPPLPHRLTLSAPLPHRPLCLIGPLPHRLLTPSALVSWGWGGHRQPAQCLGGLHPLIEAMHAPWMSHVRSTTARPKAWSRGTKTVLLLPPAEASVARSRGFSARRQHPQACDQLRIDGPSDGANAAPPGNRACTDPATEAYSAACCCAAWWRSMRASISPRKWRMSP